MILNELLFYIHNIIYFFFLWGIANWTYVQYYAYKTVYRWLRAIPNSTWYNILYLDLGSRVI